MTLLTNTQDKDKNKPTDQKDVSFLDHLDELRLRIAKSLLYSLFGIIVCAVFSDFIVNEVLLRPILSISGVSKLQNLVPYGQVSLYLQAVLFFGLVVSFPIIAHQMWKFIEPGLNPKEKSSVKFVVFFLSLCFFCGISFGYFVVLPVSLNFFQSFGSVYVQNNIAVSEYVSFVIGTLLTTGIMFELPFAVYLFSKVGILTASFMKRFRRYAIVAILILASIVTPSTDAVTMAVVALPMLLLYEISIFISFTVERKRKLIDKS